MPFFAAFSSSIGKRLLLFGLRQIDILDKDPADFVSVDVGKKTTLEVRDVGLHIAKLVALLHLKLPPEIQLSTARASLLRVTFVLDFGVPQILIDIDGIQVHARLVASQTETHNPDPAGTKSRGTEPQSPRPRKRSPSPSSLQGPLSDTSSDIDDERLPTAEDLANSFIREEPAEEIRELEEAINTQSEYLQESIGSSSDGDDESVAGVGAPLGLPGYLKNLINTALDRVQISANNIDIQVEDQLPSETTNSGGDADDASVSLNFHVHRVTVDSVTAQDPTVNVAASALTEDALSKLGKRRMRIENLCGRLISDADYFTSVSRVSVPASPVETRSEMASSFKARSEASISHSKSEADNAGSPVEKTTSSPPLESSLFNSFHESSHNIYQEEKPVLSTSHDSADRIVPSVTTPDEDKYADADAETDAASDDGSLGLQHSALSESHHEPEMSHDPQDITGSSILYNNDTLEYALENNLINSATSASTGPYSPLGASFRWEGDDEAESHHAELQTSREELPISGLLASSTLEPSPPNLIEEAPVASSNDVTDVTEQSITGADNLESAQRHALDPSVEPNETLQRSIHSDERDLSESKLFTHDDAESMYMSAMSGPPTASSHQQVPGAWDSASNSSQGTSSDVSGPIPADMVVGSILAPAPDVEDGCETPRPGSRQSVVSPPRVPSGPSLPDPLPLSSPAAQETTLRIAKQFLHVDHITLWFPLGLSDDDNQVPQFAEEQSAAQLERSELSFSPPNVVQDSIFQEMPGSFSNYAHSTTSRKKGSIDFKEPAGKRSSIRSILTEPTPRPKRDGSATISIQVGSVISHIDFSTGRIMFQILNRVLKAVSRSDGADQKPATKPDVDTPISTLASVELAIHTVSIAWVERLVAEPVSASALPLQYLDSRPPDGILRMNLSSIKFTGQLKAQEIRSKLLIGKFVFSSLDHDIISFLGQKPRSRRPVSGSSDQLLNDIEIDFEKAKESRITIVTRPVKVKFDIQKLDEALGSFGGFSGVLELGSSISSGSSSPVISAAVPRQRGVRFGDSPATEPEPVTSSSSLPKIDIQFGEVSFTLKGKSCSIQLQTTTVRAAIRASNVRLKVAEVQFSGPHTDSMQSCAPLLIEVKGTTVNFLYAPEEIDLTRLISMITPSKDPYESNEDILIETLLRQRRKGSVVRLEMTSVGVRVSDLDQLKVFEALGAEVARLSKVTKYLPDDDRPGILTLASVQAFDALVAVNDKLGDISVALEDTSLAHVGVPSLFAIEVGKASVLRDEELLIHELVKLRQQDHLPMIMARVVGDEMEPIVKVKLFNLCTEYYVTTVMAALGIADDGTANDIAVGLASSVATITGTSSPKALSRQTSDATSISAIPQKPLHLDILFRSCALGLNPRNLASKGLFVLTDAHFLGKQVKKDYIIDVELRKASIHAIDDVSRVTDREVPPTSSINVSLGQRQLTELGEQGYVSLSSISAAKVLVNIAGNGNEKPQTIDIEFKNELFVLESCADSTQTLIAVLNGLQPPSPPSTAQKYRTVVPLQEMMESFTGDAFAAPEGVTEENFMDNADLVVDEVPANLEFVGSFYNPESLPTDEDLGDSMLEEDDLGAVAPSPVTRMRGQPTLLESFQEQYEVAENENEFDFDDNYFKDSESEYKGKARKWDSRKNQYHLTNEFKIPNAPLKVRVRDMNIVWNLFDGYDWPRTRSIISQAVDDVEARAEERRQRVREEEEDDDFVEQDFLFNSVWIGVPIKDEKGALAKQINHDIDDLVSETGSYATSTATRSTGATIRPRSSHKSRRRTLKLERSKNKKIAFQLSGIAVDLVVYPENTGETQNSLNVRVHEFEIYDHVPSSTWRKFVTSLTDPSQREVSRAMIDLEILTVRPVTDLAASELVINVKVLPLRLHVDQDALDFITRFFEFKDDTAPESTAPSDQPFIQRLEVKAVTLKLDYKPKRVDYRGLRSGHTTEFMNFVILDGSDIVLRHAIVYGITSFDKLHKTLNDVWMPDVKRNQLPGVLAGLAAVRPIVNVGSGMRDLVVVPMREYKKDGRIVRSLQKGVFAFAKNTTSEVARLGAKVAIGTQNLLEGAENFLNPQSSSPRSPSALHEWDDFDPADTSDDEPRAVSNYANQPLGVKAGMRSAARHLERDLLTAKDAVIAIPAEVMEEGTGIGMAKVIARRAPTIILKPALGATKAVSNALLGVGNALDKDSKRKIDDKYKSY